PPRSTFGKQVPVTGPGLIKATGSGTLTQGMLRDRLRPSAANRTQETCGVPRLAFAPGWPQLGLQLPVPDRHASAQIAPISFSPRATEKQASGGPGGGNEP